MRLTDRDISILLALTGQVRQLTLSQLAIGWWSSTLTGQKNAAHRLSQLVRASLIIREEVLAHPILPLQRPVIEWIPGDPLPQFDIIAKRLQSRWCAHPHRTFVYLASPAAASLFGGVSFGKVHNSCQKTHDIHVGQIFLNYRNVISEHLPNWIGEDRCDRSDPTRRTAKSGIEQAESDCGVPSDVVGGGSDRQLRVRTESVD